MFTVYIVLYCSGNMNERVVLYFKIPPITPVTQVDFLWFPTTNLFEAFVRNFLAQQKVMYCVRGGLTFHLEDKAV